MATWTLRRTDSFLELVFRTDDCAVSFCCGRAPPDTTTGAAFAWWIDHGRVSPGDLFIDDAGHLVQFARLRGQG